MRAVVQEAQSTSAACGIVDNLGNHGSGVVEEELVADTYLTGRLHKDIPQAHFPVQFPEQEHLYLGIGLLLGAIESGGEYLGIVEYKDIAFIEIVDDIAELYVFSLNGVAVSIFLEEVYLSRLTVQHHQSGLVTAYNPVVFCLPGIVLELTVVSMRIERNLLIGQFEFEL